MYKKVDVFYLGMYSIGLYQTIEVLNIQIGLNKIYILLIFIIYIASNCGSKIARMNDLCKCHVRAFVCACA